MNVGRIAAVVVSFSLGLMFLCGFGALVYLAGLPVLRELGGKATTTFVMLHVGALALSGWQILAFDGLLLLAEVALVMLGIHLLGEGNPD